MSAGTINLRAKNYFLRVAVEAWERGIFVYILQPTFPVGSVSKESARNAGDPGSILGLERSSGEGNGTQCSILAWRIPWIEESGGLQSMGSQRVRHD